MAAPPAPTPALLITSVGGPENQAMDCLASAWTSPNCETSQRLAVALAPASVIASTVRWAAASSMSLQTTVPPRRPSSMAKAAPMPLPAPVTTADAPRLALRLPSSLSSISQRTSVIARASCRAWVTKRAT